MKNSTKQNERKNKETPPMETGKILQHIFESEKINR